MERAKKAAELFMEGFNCAQAVAIAFCDETGLTQQQSAKMVSSFGGGMGRMREVCGAVSGMLFVAGCIYGYDAAADETGKRTHYARVQQLAGKFREQMGSIVCRELLKNPPSDPNPTPRSPQFYKDRPCAAMVYYAAEILEEYLKENPREDS